MRPHHPRKRRHSLRGLVLLLLTLAAAGLFLRWSNTALQITRFDPAFTHLPQGFDGCRIALLSDLHGTSFGRDGDALFSAVAAEQPD
ncbi:MAG: hypothetical protein E7469_09440, partial [Ruminococcaceae bacterium]|nr:hypothetical protein [Oscillospiraceae bacterium]